MTAALCPDCRAERPPGTPSCPSCGLPLTGPEATELGRLDRELVDLGARLAGLDRERAQLQARQAQLFSRRAELINILRAALARPRAASMPAGSTTGAQELAARAAQKVASGPATGAQELAARVAQKAVSTPVGTAVRTAEASSHSIQTILLVLGGLLLAVAAIVFTVVAWSRFGIAGRATILSGLTAVMLTTPAALVRFRLPATGETIAAVGLVLVALDGYAAWYVGFLGVDDAVPRGVYAGIVATVVTTVAAVYPMLVPLRLPRLFAIVTGQAAIPLLASSTALPWGTAATATVGANLAVIWVARRHRATPEVVLASIGAGAFALIAGAQALWKLVNGDLTATIGAAVVLAVLAGLGLLAAELVRGVARQFAAGFAALAVGAGAFAVFARAVDDHLVTGGAVLAALLVVVSCVVARPWRAGALSGAGAVLGVAAAVPAFWSMAALVAPLAWIPRAWSFDSAWSVARLVPGETYAPAMDVAVALMPLAVAVVALAWRLGGQRAAGYAVVVPAVAATFVVPVALAAPLAAVLIAEVTVAAAAGAGAFLLRPYRTVLTTTCLLVGAHAALWSVLNETATLVTVGALVLMWAALAALRVAGNVTAAGALLAVTGETAAVAAALEASRFQVALAIFAATLVASGFAALVRRYSLAAMVTVPVSASAGVLTGAVDAGRPDVALLSALAGVAVLVAAVVGQVGARERRPVTGVLGAFGLIGLTLGGLLLIPVLVQVVFGPLSWTSAIWDGAPARAGAGLGTLGWDGTGFDVVSVIVLGVGAALFATIFRPQPVWRDVVTAVVPFWAVALVTVPLALDAPWVVGLGTMVLVALGGAAVAALTSGFRAVLGTVFAAVFGVTSLCWSLASEPATITVLGIIVLAGTAAAPALDGTGPVSAREAGASAPDWRLLAEAGTVAAALDVPQTGYAVLGAAAALAGGAALLRTVRATQSVALEVVAGIGGLAAFALAIGDTWHAALVLTLAGLAVGLTALRPDRRPAAVLAIVLELAASWLWLWDAGVETPEAYTVPAALIALATGLVALRRQPGMSSWTALAPGLAGAFLPSLVLVFGADSSPWRSLLLGVAALGVTIAGAVTRRQAPFLLGSGTVALVALREIWPLLPRIAAAVPAWVPLALGGILLVALGATFEQRRRDLSRARRVVARMN